MKISLEISDQVVQIKTRNFHLTPELSASIPFHPQAPSVPSLLLSRETPAPMQQMSQVRHKLPPLH